MTHNTKSRLLLIARSAVCVAVVLMTSVLFAKPGYVMTDDATFIGDVSEKGDQYVIKSGENNIQVSKTNAKKVAYFDDFKQEFDFRLKSLAKDDAPGHAALATLAMENKNEELAGKAAEAAQKIDPKNAEAQRIADQVKKSAPPPPVDPNPKPSVPAPGGGKIAGKTRLLTAEEINRIRQLEWRKDDSNVRVKIDPEARQAFIAKGIVKTADFIKLPANEQGRIMLDKGNKDVRKGVHILTDPATIQDFKQRVQKPVISTCATANCHDGSNKKTNFVLHIPNEKVKENEEAATYTNFLILQDYSTTIDKVQRDMIDRTRPDRDSLLAQFLLPPAAADIQHPKVQGFKGGFKTAADPRYRAVTAWLASRPVIEPQYEIDLMKPPKSDKEGSRDDAAAVGAAEKSAAGSTDPATDEAGATPAATSEKGSNAPPPPPPTTTKRPVDRSKTPAR